MDDVQRLLGPTEKVLADLIANTLPGLGLALVVLFAGVVFAFLFRSAANGLNRRLNLDALAERFGVARMLYALQIRGGLGAVLANLGSLVVLLVSVYLAAEIVGLPGIAEGIGAVIEFLPRLVSAGIVAVFGFAAAEFTSRIAEGIGQRRSDIVAPKFAANVVYYGVLAVVLTTSVQHLGMDTGLIDLLFGVVLAAVLGSVALSFAWASRLLLQDVLTRPYAMHHLRSGSHIRVGAVSGTLIATNTLTVSIRTDDGEVAILPYRRLLADEGFAVEAPPE